jgi:hypothetical protein
MKRAIEGALARLVGQPLWAVGRAGSLAWFHFGDRHVVSNRRGDRKEVGSFALHLDCPWSWTRSWGEVLADQDSDHDELTELLPTPVICERIEAGDDGSFRMTFDDNSTLEARADPDPEVEEYWRFFEPHLQTPHFVVGPKGGSGRGHR